MGVPNLLTLLRIILIPVLVLVYLLPVTWSYIGSALVFAIAATTDWLDGYLARRLGQATRFGAFLDPVADKLMIVTALVLLVGDHANLWLTIPAVVIVGREIVISALREWMAEIQQRGHVRVSLLGKVKTAAQIAAVIALLANEPDLHSPWVVVGYLTLYVAAILTLWSMVQYLHAAWSDLEVSVSATGAEGVPPND